MFPTQYRQTAAIIAMLLTVALSAGLASAHDTGQPHSHNSVDDANANSLADAGSLAPIDESDALVFESVWDNHSPVAIVVISTDGKLYTLQWLLQHLCSVFSAPESAARRAYTHSHEHSHSHSHMHSHEHTHGFSITSARQDETGQTVSSTQID